jgi:2-polyprenyl-6-methoxyphenol hydroxylase-like FAD-dependent oxidoreductase
MDTNSMVLIVGAGPTGLSMAIELKRLGIPFRIIDKQIKPIKTSNALAVQTRTLEVWDDWGVVKAAIEQGLPIIGFSFYEKQRQIVELNFAELKSNYHFVLALSQHKTESILLQYLKENQILVEMEVSIIDLVTEIDSVTATLLHANGEKEFVKADWVIACDGAHSWMREKCNIPFIGEELKEHFVFADVEIKSNLPKDRVNFFSSRNGSLIIINHGNKYARIFAEVANDPELKKATSLTLAQLQRLIQERCSFPIEVKEPNWTSGFWIHERYVKSFKVGRIFFAGDAAHIHSPAGGQGMNTGIQDANNLAWKLAWVIQKKTHARILETYHQERFEVAKKVLKRTTFLTKMMTIKNPVMLLVRNLFLLFIMRSKFISQKLMHILTQLTIHYPESMVVKDCLQHQSGPLAGTRMIDVKLADSYLLDVIRGTQMVILCFMGLKDAVDMTVYTDLKAAFSKKYSDPIKFILIRTINEFSAWDATKIWDKEKKIHSQYHAETPCIYVIRPDKYIGFRGNLTHLDELNRWLENIYQMD